LAKSIFPDENFRCLDRQMRMAFDFKREFGRLGNFSISMTIDTVWSTSYKSGTGKGYPTWLKTTVSSQCHLRKRPSTNSLAFGRLAIAPDRLTRARLPALVRMNQNERRSGQESHFGDDFAIAMVDEIEQRAHSRQRFTVRC